MYRLAVAVDTPQHAGLGDVLDYEAPEAWLPGTLVRVPLGKRETLGVVWQVDDDAPAASAADGSPVVLKAVIEALGSLPPLPPTWCALVSFTARYYQRALGEVALSVLPPELRKLDDAGLLKRLRKLIRTVNCSSLSLCLLPLQISRMA